MLLSKEKCYLMMKILVSKPFSERLSRDFTRSSRKIASWNPNLKPKTGTKVLFRATIKTIRKNLQFSRNPCGKKTKSWDSSKTICRDTTTKIPNYVRRTTWSRVGVWTSREILSSLLLPWIKYLMILAVWEPKWDFSKIEWPDLRKSSAVSENRKPIKFSKLESLPKKKRDLRQKFRRSRPKMCRPRDLPRPQAPPLLDSMANSRAKRMTSSSCYSRKTNSKKWSKLKR